MLNKNECLQSACYTKRYFNTPSWDRRQQEQHVHLHILIIPGLDLTRVPGHIGHEIFLVMADPENVTSLKCTEIYS